MKKLIIVSVLLFNYSLFSQIAVSELNKFTITRIAEKDAISNTELNTTINNLCRDLSFWGKASKKKVFWPNGRPNKGTGYGIYKFGFTYECHWKKYLIDGKLTIKYKDILVFEGTAKDGFIQQGIMYVFEKFADGIYKYPKYYGKFDPVNVDKDYYGHYNVNGIKFFLDYNSPGNSPSLKEAFGTYNIIDAYDSKAYKGTLFYYKNVAKINENPDWHLLYKFGGRGGENISYEQLHNYETANTAFYSKQPKYYVKCPYYDFDKCKVINTKTNLPIKFNPKHIIEDYFKVKRKDSKARYVYYDDEDWQKRLDFIAAENAEKERLKRIEDEKYRIYAENKRREGEIQQRKDDKYNATHIDTYKVNGKIHHKIVSSEETPLNYRIPAYRVNITYSLNSGTIKQENCKVMAISTKTNATYRRDVLLNGEFEGTYYFTKYKNFNDSLVEGYFYTTSTLSEHRFSGNDLFYIGIVSSHTMYPTQSWSNMNGSTNGCYSVTQGYRMTNGGGVKFRYIDKNNNSIVVIVGKRRFDSERHQVAFKIKIEINKKVLKKSLSDTFNEINKSQQKINEAMKEYNEKMKVINKNLEQINKEREELNKKKQDK